MQPCSVHDAPPAGSIGVSAVPAGRRRILLVEDDPSIQRVLQLALREEGFVLTVTASGIQALHLLDEQPADVVLVDLMLPDLGGLEVCRQIRRNNAIPIMIITARSDSHDVVAGLEAGADDYVVKPFVAKVLAARIRALIRRARVGSSASPMTIQVGPLVISPAEAVVTRSGTPLPLTRTEFLLLVELAGRLGEVVGRAELLERVWGYDHLGDGRLVDVHIRRLRAKIELHPGQPQHLVTVRGLGYKLQA